MKKATHDGQCQLCGREQRLPDGHLSKHGYTVKWNCFIGQCPGSYGLPFEQSCDLLEEGIARAKASADHLNHIAHELRAVAGTRATCWMNHYDSRTCKRSWIEVVVQEEAHPYDSEGVAKCYYTFFYMHQDRRHTINTEFKNRQVDVARTHDLRRAGEWFAEAQRYLEYASWLQGRVDTWTPRELKLRRDK